MINITTRFIIFSNRLTAKRKPMANHTLARPALVAVLLFTLGLLAWEFYLRSTRFDLSFDDGGPLWTWHRDRAYLSPAEGTIFIGSSRIKFDLDVPTWESITGEKAVQLACVGSTPLPILHDLAEDEQFRGKLVIDVTEGLFFSTNPGNADRPTTAMKYREEITPAQRASFLLNRPLESTFVFLDKDHYSINAMLDALEIPSREGVWMGPIFARDFGLVKFSRQEYLADPFLEDTAQIHKQRAIWALFGSLNQKPPISGPPLDSMLQTIKVATDKIKARGGQVLFVRTPSSGPFLEKEMAGFPREQYWDRILSVTGCPGVHFMDYPQIASYQCPEFSHLSPRDAEDFTRKFIDILVTDHQWSFLRRSVQ